MAIYYKLVGPLNQLICTQGVRGKVGMRSPLLLKLEEKQFFLKQNGQLLLTDIKGSYLEYGVKVSCCMLMYFQGTNIRKQDCDLCWLTKVDGVACH